MHPPPHVRWHRRPRRRRRCRNNTIPPEEEDDSSSPPPVVAGVTRPPVSTVAAVVVGVAAMACVVAVDGVVAVACGGGGHMLCWWWCYAHYIGFWLGLIAKTVRPYIRPYIDWFEYLKSWLKKSIRSTTKHIRRCYVAACIAAVIYYPIYYFIWTPIYATVDLIRGYIMEFLKPDLKRERLRREQLWQVSASRRVYSTKWRGLPFLASMNLVFGLAGPHSNYHPTMKTMHHLDPEFLRPKEMIMAYASQVHHVPNLPTSASNIGMQPGVLCLRVQNVQSTCSGSL